MSSKDIEFSKKVEVTLDNNWFDEKPIREKRDKKKCVEIIEW